MYPTRKKSRAGDSRGRILEAVRELLEEGTFHETTVEEVAERAGVSRATLYGHFGSRLGLVDAICESFSANPALARVREADDVDSFIEFVVDLWAAEEKMLLQLHGAASVDPAARDYVARQRRDRYGELRRLLRTIGRDDPDAFSALAMLTSFETYVELRRVTGRSKRDVVALLKRAAHALL